MSAEVRTPTAAIDPEPGEPEEPDTPESAGREQGHRPPAGPTGRDHPTRTVWAALALVSVASAGLLAWGGRQVFLFSDDYIFLTEAREQPWGLDYLRLALFEHFSPVSRVVHRLVTNEVADHPQVIYLVLVTLAVALVASVALLMGAVCGPRWAVVVGTAVIAPSLSVLPLMNWWTAGVNIMPAMIGTTVCFGSLVMLVRGRSWAWVWGVVAVLGYLLGVLSWELAASAPAFALLWVLLFRRRVTAEPLAAMLRRTAWAWGLLVVIGLATVLNYLQGYYRRAPSASLADNLHALYVSLVETQLPLMLGLHRPADPIIKGLGAAAGLVVLAVLVVVTCRRSPTAWRGWAFALVGWFVPCVALVVSRVGYWGVVVAEQPTYYFLPTLLIMVGVLEAWLAPRRRADAAEADAVERLTARPGRSSAPRRAVAAALIAVLAVGVAYVSSIPATLRSVYDFGAVAATGAPLRSYVPNLLASAQRLRATGAPFSVVSGEAPAGLVPSGFSPFNRLSRVMMVDDPSIPFDHVDGPWYAADASGTLVPATPVWQRELVLSAEDTRSTLAISGMDVVSQDARTGLCLVVTDPAAHLIVPLEGTVSGDRIVIRTEGTVSQTGPGRVIVGIPDGGFLPSNVDVKRWEAGQGGRLDTAFEPAVSSVAYDELTVGTQLCIRTVSVGQLTLG